MELRAVELGDSQLGVRLVPAVGAKVTSVYDRRSRREWLWTDPTRPVRPVQPGGVFAEYDISGFDECFPTIGACAYPEKPYAGLPLPDHGEVWSVGWATAHDGEAVTTTVSGGALPYRLSRTARVDSGVLRLDYRLTNAGPAPLAYHWSAHPLFAVAPGMRLELPGRPRLVKEFGLGGLVGPDEPDGRQGYLGTGRWPFATRADTSPVDLRELDFPTPPATYKVYAVDLTEGWARLVDPVRGEGIEVRWPLATVPYLGVCVNMGAWPETGAKGRWVALEPCTATCDRLDLAAARGECARLAGGSEAVWWVELEPLTGGAS